MCFFIERIEFFFSFLHFTASFTLLDMLDFMIVASFNFQKKELYYTFNNEFIAKFIALIGYFRTHIINDKKVIIKLENKIKNRIIKLCIFQQFRFSLWNNGFKIIEKYETIPTKLSEGDKRQTHIICMQMNIIVNMKVPFNAIMFCIR